MHSLRSPPSRHSLGSTIYTTIQFGCERTLCITAITLTLPCSALFVFLCFSSSRDFLFSSASPFVFFCSHFFLSLVHKNFFYGFTFLTKGMEAHSASSRLSSFRKRVHLHCPLVTDVPGCHQTPLVALCFSDISFIFWHNQRKIPSNVRSGRRGGKESRIDSCKRTTKINQLMESFSLANATIKEDLR